MAQTEGFSLNSAQSDGGGVQLDKGHAVAVGVALLIGTLAVAIFGVENPSNADLKPEPDTTPAVLDAFQTAVTHPEIFILPLTLVAVAFIYGRYKRRHDDS